ncbi:nucleotidyl transferase AbiEii/AbiGii toxin family protein [Desulfobacula sp.]|uniref:Nucleotidyl transferase AbiEii/AbiGii toxin family protein n=1 Tax=Candidatus Desulfatibia vada TaxID=2841696 RepID=A0A8J6NUU0_9BACT|nr:nucleotidyl transferase AbiEii/AbiGii toxin family protein [Candidatus Desulfatibia vada]MBL6995593.1 nucleotidyl transferase AbiEii/AbiGii toxin family protein [Desulfobacula sp.]
MKDTVFFKQAELLLRILPLIYKEEVFALKGGTAINFFVRDLPRLSVDIDLTYLPVNDRDFALNEIRSILLLISEGIKKRIPGTGVIPKRIHGTEIVRGLIVDREGVTVKIEPNLVLRGAVYPPERKTLSKKAQDLFELSLQSRTLSTYDLYAGKICAALDRQHPRDLFDVRLLLKNEGLTSEIRKAFVVYLVSHPRPMAELISPRQKDISEIFEKEFKGMIAESITFEALETTRHELVAILQEELTPDERQFIVSIKQGQPVWDLLELEGIQNLPAVKWKLLNISRMDPTKHQTAVHKLRDCLGV